MKKYCFIILISLFFYSVLLTGQNLKKVALKWEEPVDLMLGGIEVVPAVSFSGAQYPFLPEVLLPFSVTSISLADGHTVESVKLIDLVYSPFSEEDQRILKDISLPEAPELNYTIQRQAGKDVIMVTVLPFGIDPLKKVATKLSSYSIATEVREASVLEKTTFSYAQNSVLSSGNWYKIYVGESGIYKITYDDLKKLGINTNGLNPDNIRVFGNGGAMLDDVVGDLRADDLNEAAIKVVTASPGVFKQGDYVLFYGEGTQTWKNNPFSNRLEHTTHLYADEACYFINVDQGAGRRISTISSPSAPANYSTEEYNDVYVYEKELYNLLKSGSKWFGDKLDFYTRTVTLPKARFRNIVPNVAANLRYGIAARSVTGNVTFNILINGQAVSNSTLAKITSDYGFANELTTSASFVPPTAELDIQVRFNPSSSTDIGWLDFVALNVRSYLKFTGGQFEFSDPKTIAAERITQFTLSDAAAVTEIWDISDPMNVGLVDFNKTGGVISFRSSTDRLKTFVAIDGSEYKSIKTGAKVPNQNLHAIGNFDMIIISPPEFATPAKRLAAAHNNMGQISAIVVSLPEIYNEFSSGVQDITAIRNFMKMLYDRGKNAGYPKYLLLFGNASYDLKNRVAGNTNFVPTYQSANSVTPVNSFLSDDYFVMLDKGEGGETAAGMLDLAVGRFPVRNINQANVVVDKTITYMHNEAKTHGDWRNTLIVIADDENNNTHLNQAEQLASKISESNPEFNIEKLYFDAFKQVSTPGGSLYPEVNRELVSRVEKGALLVNYIGHGGEVGWADERILEIADINAWTNYDRMGLFFTATCEFSRFDNPALTSAGELVFLNPNGGALNMITTTRLAFSNTNAALNLSFADTAFSKGYDNVPRIGDILKYTKNQLVYSANTRHLTLFGDPSLRMPLPRYQVVTTSITDANTGKPSDTLYAMRKVKITGEVRNADEMTISGFNGELQVKIFDKPARIKTLGQDPQSFVTEFRMHKNIIYQGKASVRNGQFEFTFLVPKDIDYSFGRGKISYYATDGVDDANGMDDNILVGGSGNQLQTDFTPPQIRIFMNDTNFIDGGLTSEYPKLLAFFYDESGINTIGNGIGHDIVATIDGDSYSSVVLNDFYVSDVDSYQKGRLLYQYFNLPEGPHELTLKAWDIFNNSASATLKFEVRRNILLDVDEVLVFPNPSPDKVTIRFGHNLFDGRFDVELEIFTSTGQLARYIGPFKVQSEGYVAGGIEWDGRLADGSAARSGLYLARLKVRDRNGNTSTRTAKIIISKP